MLHVCIDGAAEKIKIWYQELIKNLLSSASRDECRNAMQRRIESLRFILAYLHRHLVLASSSRAFETWKNRPISTRL